MSEDVRMKHWHNGIVRAFEISGAHKIHFSLRRFVEIATYHFWELKTRKC